MKTTTETLVLLYYRGYSQRPLVCVCESEEIALEEIHRLREEWPDIYSEPERFETNLVRYVRRAY